MVRSPDRKKMGRADWPVQWILLKHQITSMRRRAVIGKGTGPIEPLPVIKGGNLNGAEQTSKQELMNQIEDYDELKALAR